MSEGRAIWLWESQLDKPGVEATIEQLKAHHISILLPHAPWLDKREFWEQKMAPFIRLAHANGMQVHPWVNALDPASVDNREELYQRDRSGGTTTPNGTLGCPANPEVRRLNVEKLVAIVRQYDVDGIHLEDNFTTENRTNSPQQPELCYCAYCKAHAPKPEPERVKYKREVLTQCLADIRRGLTAARPGIKLSVAAMVPYVLHSLMRNADWKTWCDRGLLDFVCPMCYSLDNQRFRQVAQEAIAIGHWVGIPVYVGVGVQWSGGEITPQQVTDQIGIARELGAQGITLYHMGGLKPEHWQRVAAEFTGPSVPVFAAHQAR